MPANSGHRRQPTKTRTFFTQVFHGWACSEEGDIVNRELRIKGAQAYFKYAPELKANDVWRMRFEVGGKAFVGFAGAWFDVRGGCRGVQEHRLCGSGVFQHVHLP